MSRYSAPFTFFLLFAMLILGWAQPAQATLAKPLRGADVRDTFSRDQMERARVFWSVKSDYLETASVDAARVLGKVEKVHALAKLALGLGDIFASVGDYAGKYGDKIAQMARITKALDKRRLNKYSNLKRLTPEAAEVAIQLALIIGDYASTLSDFREEMGGEKLFPELSSITPEKVGAFLESLPGQIVTASVVEVLPVLMSMDDCKSLLNDSRFVWKLLRKHGVAKGMRLAWKAKAVLNPADYVGTAAGIVVDLSAAAYVAKVNSYQNSDLLAMEFLDYYYVTYGGDWSRFQGALDWYGTADLEKALDHFANQRTEYGGTFKEYYGGASWLDFLNHYGSDLAAQAVVRATATSGPLALRIASNEPAAIYPGCAVTYHIEIDPLLAGKFRLADVGITQTDPAGNVSNFAINGSGSFTPNFSLLGESRFLVQYILVDRVTGQFTSGQFPFYRRVTAPSASAPQVAVSAGSAMADGDGYQMALNVTLPSLDLTTITTLSPMQPMQVRARVRYHTETITDVVTEWQEISPVVGASATFMVAVAHSGAVLEKSGLLGDYAVELEVDHPLVSTVATSTTRKSLNFADLAGIAGPDPAYLLVTVPDKSKAAPGDEGYLYLSPTDPVRLQKENSTALSAFAGLTDIRVYLMAEDGSTTSVSASYQDNGLNIAAVGVPAGRYSFLAVAGIRPDGVKDARPLVGLVKVQQEIAADQPGADGESIPGGRAVTWPSWVRGGQSWGFPGVATNVKAIADGGRHNLVLKQDGTVAVWGSNYDGQLTTPAGLKGVVAVAASAMHNLALMGDGTVAAWGSTRTSHYETRVPEGLNGVVAVSAGRGYSLALKSDGTVVSWGWAPGAPAGLGGVAAISAGLYHVLASKRDGTVVAWGDNYYKQSDVPAGLGGVVAVSAGLFHSLALKGDGTVVAWGENKYGKCDVPAGLNGVIAIAAGYNHSLALKSDGTVVAWGDNSAGQTTVPAGLSGVVAIAAAQDHSTALKSDGTVVTWSNFGTGPNDALGIEGAVAVAARDGGGLVLKSDGTVAGVPGLSGVKGIALARSGFVALREDGSVVTAGGGVVSKISDAVAVAAGNFHYLALQSDGTVSAWQNDNLNRPNEFGQCDVPPGLNGVIAIAAGDNHSLAVKSDGTVVAWGDNRAGQASVPAGLTGVVAVAAGSHHSLALKSDGSVVVWGEWHLPEDGDFYNGDSTRLSVPGGLTGVVAIAAGGSQSMALKGDGTVVVWGGAEGNPVPAGLSAVRSIACGDTVIMAVADTVPNLPNFPSPAVTLLSENIPKGSYAVTPQTKTWKFKNGPTTTYLQYDFSLAQWDATLNTGRLVFSPSWNVAPYQEFTVSTQIYPIHGWGTSVQTNSFALRGTSVVNTPNGQFGVEVVTNKPPVFSRAQLDSVAGSVGKNLQLPLLVGDPENDQLEVSVVSGPGALLRNPWVYANTFSAAGVYPITVEATDAYGGKARFTFQAVISDGSGVSRMFTDVPYPADRVANKQQYDQYLAIHYLALNGVVIGRPENPADLTNTNRVFQPQKVANRAEALATLIRAAQVRGLVQLPTEARRLPNLVREDAVNEVFFNFSWLAPYLVKAEELGMIDKAEDFDPSLPATREWMAQMLAQLLGLAPPLDAIVNQSAYSFADESAFSTPAGYDDARAAAFFGYLGELGPAALFQPAEPMIRADMAVVASRVLRAPSFDSIGTAGLTFPTADLGQVTAGDTFQVNQLRNLAAHRILDHEGWISEDPAPPADYVLATVVRVGSGVVAETMANTLAGAPVTVPTATPALTASELRDLLVVATDTDSGIRAMGRQKYLVDFPDADGDGVRDEEDYFPYDALHWLQGPSATITYGQLGSGTCVQSPGLGGESCSSGTRFALGSAVTLHATPRVGTSFVGWSGACAGNAPDCTLTLDADKSVQAIFSDGVLAGSCGSSNGGTFSSSPIANLCATGTPSSVTGTGPWSWSCAGSNGGSTAFCFAMSTQVNGSCGSSNGATFDAAPTSNLCWAGNPSPVTGTGPWSWNCAGSNGGSTSSCSAKSSKITVTTQAGPRGSILPASASGTAPFSTSFTITSQPGYAVASATGCGGTLAGTTYTTGSLTSDCRVDVMFSKPGSTAALQGTYRYVQQDMGISTSSFLTALEGGAGTVVFDGTGGCTITYDSTKLAESASGVVVTPSPKNTACGYAVDDAGEFVVSVGSEAVMRGYVQAGGETFITYATKSYRVVQAIGVRTSAGKNLASLNGSYDFLVQDSSLRTGNSQVFKSGYLGQGTFSFDGTGGCTASMSGTGLEMNGNYLGSHPELPFTFACSYTVDDGGLVTISFDGMPGGAGYLSASGQVLVAGGFSQRTEDGEVENRFEQTVMTKMSGGKTAASLAGTYHLNLQELRFKKDNAGIGRRGVAGSEGTISFDGRGGCSTSFNDVTYWESATGVTVDSSSNSESCSYSVSPSGEIGLSFSTQVAHLSVDDGFFSVGIAKTGGSNSVMQAFAVKAASPQAEPPINGSCGASAGGAFAAPPAAGLCAAGTASPVAGAAGWSWTCSGANGGSNANCSAAIATQPLTVTLTGSGSGSVTSNPSGIACTGGSCSAPFNQGSTVTLLPNPNHLSIFAGWSDGCSGLGACSVAMDGARSVTASFKAAAKARIGSAEYPSFASAYAAAASGDVIRALDWVLPDTGVILALNKSVTLAGGYQSDYGARSGLLTVLSGKLTIRSGKLVADRVVVR